MKTGLADERREVQLNIRLCAALVEQHRAAEGKAGGQRTSEDIREPQRTKVLHQPCLRTQGGKCLFVKLPTSHSGDIEVLTMRGMCVCLCLALLLPLCTMGSSASAKLGEDTQRHMLAVDILNRSGVLNSLLSPEYRPILRQVRAPRPASQVPKRAQQGSRFALSLDVPTSILSVLIDLAKNQDMRTKAAANAELMARIGKRK